MSNICKLLQTILESSEKNLTKYIRIRPYSYQTICGTTTPDLEGNPFILCLFLGLLRFQIIHDLKTFYDYVYCLFAVTALKRDSQTESVTAS